MKENKSRIAMIWAATVGCLCLAAALLPNATAQNPPAAGGRFGRARFFGTELLSAGKVVTGAPYSAQAVTEHTQVLADGNAIHTTTTANVYRDSQGRTRREQEVGAIGPWAAEGGPRKLIAIADPVGGSMYMLNPNTQAARQMPFPAHAGARRNAERPQRAKAENTNVTTESLGTQVINGVTAQGTRTTRTIPAGQVGNQAPIVITIERWYSPDLQTDVMRKETNPQFGETTFRLTNIVRAEPQASLFQVPSNYTVKSGRPSNHGPAEAAPVEQ
jgi:hypothetical protein